MRKPFLGCHCIHSIWSRRHGQRSSANTSATTGLPVANFPKQAVVVIHGMGEQMPMDTIKGFVRAAWETVTDLTANGLPNPAEVWSKPDVRTGSLELRRITTRQSITDYDFCQRSSIRFL